MIDDAYIQFTNESRVIAAIRGKIIQIFSMNGMKTEFSKSKGYATIVSYLGTQKRYRVV